MDQPNPQLESELRISYRWMAVMFLLLGLGLFLSSDLLSDPAAQLKLVRFAALFYALALVVWLLGRWKTPAGRWCVIIGLVAIVYLGDSWLGVPGFLTLMTIPTALASALISLPAAIAAGVGETLLLLTSFYVPGVNPAIVATALGAIWATLGVMYAIYHPVYQFSHWSWQCSQQAQVLLEETREQKAKLEQALDDLARANLQLTRLNALAQGLRQAAEDARTAKEEFVANVSHELRTPLNMITGFCEMILQVPEAYGSHIPSALLADLAIIHRNAEHLSALIDDVLDLSQIDAEQMALTKEQVGIHEILDAAAIAVRPLFDSKGLYLKTDVPEDLPPVFGDRTRIREVLLNLLSNAGRFTERGGVQVRAWQEGNDLWVAVADTGPGIAVEDVGRLFQPFQQADSSIRRRYGGTGLGLSISKRFIELHGGKIWAESREGQGTTFSFRLPISSPMPTSRDFLRGITPDWEYLQHTRPSMAPKAVVHPRFVVLETGDSLQRLLTRYLDGVEIAHVTSLEEALQELSAVPSQALLINDMCVSGVLQRLESLELPNGTPVMICSVPGTYESAGTLGASDYLVKPVSQDALLAALDRLDLSGKTVLLVDDEPHMLRLFRRMLAFSGRDYRVLRAKDGQEAMNILRKYHPNVILLDLVMPKMDGFQLLKAKSQDTALRDIPVIVISARDPAGQPIVSNAMAITQGGGLSIQHVLSYIKMTGQVPSTTGQSAGPMQPAALPG